MKCFICALDGIQNNSTSYLGIPAEQTERIISADQLTDEASISLPQLFQLKDRDTPHGLVLKAALPKKITLLTPKIENELEIPEENMHGLPDALAEMHKYFTGVYFSDSGVILILDPEKLVESTGC